jgi:hypothetical protein
MCDVCHLRPRLPSLVCVFGVVLFLVGVSACRRSIPAPSVQQQESYRQAAVPIVLWLEREHAEAGTYPMSLPSELQAELETFVPPAKYKPFKGNSAYQISVGEYRVHEWTYFYSSRTKRWKLDN